jgi:hypothetical protein
MTSATLRLLALAFILSLASHAAPAVAGDAAGLNPCSAKSLNPCSGKNPCSGRNPCNPCSGKNPCNPCGGAARVNPCRFVQPKALRLGGGGAQLVAEGERLWNDKSLSTNGAACATCHQSYAQMQPSFAQPYPHRVAMVKQMSGVDAVGAAEMVQFCMLQPMQAEPFPWSSHELAALAAYVEHIQQSYQPNPCTLKNPCNPCGMKNPCNPCGMKNPCNPCGG